MIFYLNFNCNSSSIYLNIHLNIYAVVSQSRTYYKEKVQFCVKRGEEIIG